MIGYFFKLTGVACLMAVPGSLAQAPVPVYGQCGGKNYSGSKTCADGNTCKYVNEWYSQCVPSTSPPAPSGDVPLYGQCGGKNYTGSTTCADGNTCKYVNEWYSQCVKPESPVPPEPTSPPGDVPLYGQCGGKNYGGSTTCADGNTCKVINEWYSQCLPA